MERTKRQRKPSRRLEEFEGGSTDYGDGEFALAMALSESSSFAPAAAAAVDPPQSANVTQAQLAVAAPLPLATPEVDEWVACDANCKNGCGDGPAEPGEWFICREVGLRSAPEGYWRCPTCNGDVADADAEADMAAMSDDSGPAEFFSNSSSSSSASVRKEEEAEANRAAWWQQARERARSKLQNSGFLRNFHDAIERGAQQLALADAAAAAKAAAKSANKKKRKQGSGGGGSKKPKKPKKPCATTVEVEEAIVKGPNRIMLRHLMVFSLCQLRAQADRVLDRRGDFDEELCRVEASIAAAAAADAESTTDTNTNTAADTTSVDGADEADVTAAASTTSTAAAPPLPDVAACDPPMTRFLEGSGKGDRWVPWNTAVGAHERYISERIYAMAHLSDREKYLLHFVFRGSSYVPLFEHIFVPIFEAEGAAEEGSDAHRRWKQLLHEPDEAFKRFGPLHESYRAYRRLGGDDSSDEYQPPNSSGATTTTTSSSSSSISSPHEKLGKLHTSCYRPRPPKGMAGEEYTWYIVSRTRFFLGIGVSAYDSVVEKLQRKAASQQTDGDEEQQEQQLPQQPELPAAHATAESISSASSVAAQKAPPLLSLSSSSSSSLSLSSSSSQSPPPPPPPPPPPSDCDTLVAVFREFHDIGPTMSKMFLVTTHLQYPELGLLTETCTVGDGAEQAFMYLYNLQVVAKSSEREMILRALFKDMNALAPSLEPRLAPMIEWTAKQTRERFEGVMKPESLPTKLAIFELQVNLCEWRKFLKYDPHLLIIGDHANVTHSEDPNDEAAVAQQAMTCRTAPKGSGSGGDGTDQPGTADSASAGCSLLPPPHSPAVSVASSWAAMSPEAEGGFVSPAVSCSSDDFHQHRSQQTFLVAQQAAVPLFLPPTFEMPVLQPEAAAATTAAAAAAAAAASLPNSFIGAPYSATLDTSGLLGATYAPMATTAAAATNHLYAANAESGI